LVGVSVAGAKGGGACHGTYYVNVNDGQSYALWTFNQDGTFQGTDTAEVDPVFAFSHDQGAWQHTTARNVKATWLDFTRGAQPGDLARIDAEFDFVDGCQTLDGTFVLGFYYFDGYPFDPADALFSFGGSFTGQRVNP